MKADIQRVEIQTMRHDGTLLASWCFNNMGNHEADQLRRLRQAASDLRKKAAETQLASYRANMQRTAEDLEARASELQKVHDLPEPDPS